VPARRVVGLGLAVVDHLDRVDELDLGAERLRFRERRVAAGGMMANALAQVAALGCEAHALSVVGDDADGRFVRRALRAAGVVTRRLQLVPGYESPPAVVLVERRSGERRFVVPDRRAREARAPALDLAPIRRGALLLLDGHFAAQALRAARRARQLGATVIADFSRPTPAARRLLPWVDHPVVPREFSAARGETPRETLLALAREHGGAPVVTLGAEGGLYLDAGRVRRYRAPRVRVRDTTGAGDVFHGALAAGLAWQLRFGEAVRLAAAAAAANCTALGGAARLMTRAEMLRWRRRPIRSSRRGRAGRAGPPRPGG
jgi:sulfofructose kinase